MHSNELFQRKPIFKTCLFFKNFSIVSKKVCNAELEMPIECIREFDLTLVEEARWLISGHLKPLLKQAVIFEANGVATKL